MKRKNRLRRKVKPFVNRTLNRRRAERNAEGSMTMMEWVAIKHGQDYTCLCCGRKEPEIKLTRDHVLPLRQGGSNWAENIQGLCGECNSRKGAKHIDYREQKSDSL